MELFKESNAMRLFMEMDNMRKVWGAFQPEGPMSKSGLGFLGIIGRMEQNGWKKITISELAAMSRHSAPAISQKVNALEKQGYLIRSSDPMDRRICYVEMTEEGRAAAAEGFHDFLRHMEQALARLGPTRTETLLALMHELTESISQEAASCANEQTTK